MGPTSAHVAGAGKTQVALILAPWILLSWVPMNSLLPSSPEQNQGWPDIYIAPQVETS